MIVSPQPAAGANPTAPEPCHMHLFGPAKGCPMCARYEAAYSPGAQLDLLSTLTLKAGTNQGAES
jgi:hypothetical protein